MTCSRCRRRRSHVAHLPLPLTGELVALCPRCVAPAFLGHMRYLLVPHG